MTMQSVRLDERPVTANEGGRNPLVIGLVNNMPDAALRTTERQFRELLSATLLGQYISLETFFLPDVPRSDPARSYLYQNYRPIAELWNTRIDGLIVTGTQPVAPLLTDEPYWESFTRLVDWAQHHTASTVWSCLAAHAAVLHMDGIGRHPIGKKLSGVYECSKVAEHPILTGIPSRWRVPHSRYNGLSEAQLDGADYQLLSTSQDAGVDVFIKQRASLFVFLHGHPEYDTAALCREYRRDVIQFLSGIQERFPEPPESYFNEPTERALAAFRRRALKQRSMDLLADFPANLEAEISVPPWQDPATRIFTNWLFHLVTQRAGDAASQSCDTIASRYEPDLLPVQQAAIRELQLSGQHHDDMANRP